MESLLIIVSGIVCVLCKFDWHSQCASDVKNDCIIVVGINGSP